MRRAVRDLLARLRELAAAVARAVRPPRPPR